jgi:hypothetical protein
MIKNIITSPRMAPINEPSIEPKNVFIYGFIISAILTKRP